MLQKAKENSLKASAITHITSLISVLCCSVPFHRHAIAMRNRSPFFEKDRCARANPAAEGTPLIRARPPTPPQLSRPSFAATIQTLPRRREGERRHPTDDGAHVTLSTSAGAQPSGRRSRRAHTHRTPTCSRELPPFVVPTMRDRFRRAAAVGT